MRSRAWLPATVLLAVVVGLASLWLLSKPSRSPGGSTGPQAGQRPDSHRRTAKDDSGRQWELLVWPGAGRGGSAGAAGQESAESDLSRPLVGTVAAHKQGRGQVSLVLTVETAGGRQVRSVSVAGRQPPEPTFTITDESGQRVHSGKFEYG